MFEQQDLYLLQPLQEAYNDWRKEPSSFLKPTKSLSREGVNSFAALYYEAKHIREQGTLYHVKDSIYCLIFYWLGSPHVRSRNRETATQYICQRFLADGVQASPQELKEFVKEQCKRGEKLHTFCSDFLGDLGTVFFLPSSVAR